MKREERLTLGEFATAPRKPVQLKPALGGSARRPDGEGGPGPQCSAPLQPVESDDGQATRSDARKALRRLKRERLKGVQNFVNVHLDRETKRRLKLASFEAEVSMQSLMEVAIKRFLDENGY
jgi:hypothetical protein